MKNQLFLFIALSVFLTSCGHYYYISGTQNVPMFREKNEFHASGSYGLSDEAYTLEASAAYSITNHFGIITDYMKAEGGSVNGRDFGRGHILDAAAVYYHPVNKLSSFEIYGGIAHSKQYHEFSNFEGVYEGAAKMQFNRVFVQGAFGLTFDHFNVIGSLRFGGMNFYNIQCSPEANQFVREDMTELKRKTHFIIEPAVTVRGGWTYVKAQFQATLGEYLNSPDITMNDPIHLSFGLYFTIAPRYPNKAR